MHYTPMYSGIPRAPSLTTHGTFYSLRQLLQNFRLFVTCLHVFDIFVSSFTMESLKIRIVTLVNPTPLHHQRTLRLSGPLSFVVLLLVNYSIYLIYILVSFFFLLFLISDGSVLFSFNGFLLFNHFYPQHIIFSYFPLTSCIALFPCCIRKGHISF